MKKSMIFMLTLILLSLFSILYVFAIPEAPNKVVWKSTSRHTNNADVLLSGKNGTMAGNVTNVDFNVTAATRLWGAFFGNISGQIRLETSQGQAIYNWTVRTPGGKVIATVNPVTDWSQVYCWNWSKPNLNGLNQSEWISAFNVNINDSDSIQNTFSTTGAYETFYIGNSKFQYDDLTIDDSRSCPATTLLNGSGKKQTGVWDEIILSRVSRGFGGSFTQSDLLYVALIERTAKGFRGVHHDYQMILPDDGHGTDGLTTDYYFYIEFEAS
jgi:hypothetical protein